jgi:hypothetical protein
MEGGNMNTVSVEEAIRQYEFFEQEMLTEEQKRIFRIAYKMGLRLSEDKS